MADTRMDTDDPAAVAADPLNLLPNRIADWAAKEPSKPFLVEVGGRSASYGEFDAEVRRWMRWLTERGIGAGDRVASFLPGCIDACAVWLGAAAIGAYEVPISGDQRGEFLKHILTDSKAELAIVRPEQEAMVREAAPGLAVEVVRPGASPVAGVEPATDVEPARADGVSCVIYTSGTTGNAKGVMISHAQMSAIIGRIPRPWLSDADAVYAPWPMSHVTGRSPLVSMADVGGRVVIRERFSLGDFWSDIREYGITSTTPAAVVPLLMAEPHRPDERDHPLKLAWFGHLGAISLQFQERFGPKPLGSYGSTEVGFPIMQRNVTQENLGVCGWLRPGYQARVVDASGKDVPDGEPGELWIKPPVRNLVLLGYLDRPELTERATEGGWYHTGDAVTRDADGAFRFVDRLTDTIRRFGENISANALAEAISLDDEVIECAVFGVPDEIAGQQVVLVAVGPKDEAALWERLSERLTRFMVPSRIIVVDELPRSPNGKIRKRVLEEQGLLDTGWVAPRRIRTK